MRFLFPKIIPALLLWAIFIYVILLIPYPDSITQANFQQLFFFFIPLFFAIIFTLNIFLKNVFLSASISLGLNFVLIVKALDSLNLVTGVLIIISVGLLVSYFKKRKRRSLIPIESGLTKWGKIPKLTKLRKSTSSS